MSQGDTRVCGATACRSDAGDDLIGHARAAERFHLFAAAAKDERGATLEAKHALAVARESNHRVMDLLLRPAASAAALADVDTLGVATDQRENFLRDETVIQNRVALLHQPERPQREQLGIARSGAHYIDLAFDRSRIAAVAAIADHACHQPMRVGVAAREQMFRDGPM